MTPPAGADEAQMNPNKPIRDKWALVVGIGTFQNQTVPKLKYAAKDARDFRNYLVGRAHFAPDHVRLLLDEKATQRRVLSELGNKFLARVAKPDDLVVIFFSTHGSPAQADVRGKNFVVAYDSDPDDLFTTGIEMDKIVESIQSRVLSERVLLVLDACHSGAANANAKGLARTGNFDADTIAQGSGQMIICSSLPDQQSWESKRYANGIFTRKLLEALDRKETIGEAFPYVQSGVANEVQEDYASRQLPSLRSKWNGNELVLSAVPADPQALPMSVWQLLQPDSTVPTLPSSKPKPAAAKPAQKIDSSPLAEVHYRKGIAFQKAHQIDAALKEWRESFRLKSDGPIANHCAQLISYYTSSRVGISPAARQTPVVQYQSQMPATTPVSSASGKSALIDSSLIAKVRANLPKIPAAKPAPRPTFSEVSNWSLQDRANYLSEASSRVDVANTNVEQAQRLLTAARTTALPLAPNTRAYGESEQDYRARLEEGQRVIEELLVPYTAEVQSKQKIADNESTILRTCESAYQQVYQSTTGFTFPTKQNNNKK